MKRQKTFGLLRLKDGKTASQSAQIPPPDTFPVKDRPNSNLGHELRWYLERFLDYPFQPETDVADRVQESFRQWGEGAFDALFGSREGGGMLDEGTRQGYSSLHLQISGDDPKILAWPWEAIRDPKAGFFWTRSRFPAERGGCFWRNGGKEAVQIRMSDQKS